MHKGTLTFAEFTIGMEQLEWQRKHVIQTRQYHEKVVRLDSPPHQQELLKQLTIQMHVADAAIAALKATPHLKRRWSDGLKLWLYHWSVKDRLT